MTVWRCAAFGLAVEGDFPAPGLSEDLVAEGPVTRVELVALEEAADDGAEQRIDHVPGDGYHLYARGFGSARVSDDGASVRCAPPDVDPWSWQRFLVGRVLPWAAVLRGRECLHASAVTLDGRAVAIVGDTGAGKTTLAAHAMLAGAGFLTDDVLALERTADAVLAHPGPGVLAVRPAEWERLDPARLGRLIGEGGKRYLEVARRSPPAPLAAIYYLRRERSGDAIEPLAADFRLLLASTFNTAIRTPERLREQFEVCARLAATVPTFEVAASEQAPAAVAERLLGHARGLG